MNPLLLSAKLFENENWIYSEFFFENSFEKTYPNEDLDYNDYINNPNKIVFLYYKAEKCIGQVRLRKNWNNFALIEDISVSKEFRNQGVGRSLINECITWAKKNNLGGLSLETQDNNLLACRFYKKIGFIIGGVDTLLYANTNNSNEKAIYWYMVFK